MQPPAVLPTISIAEVLRGIWRRKLLVGVVTLAAFLLALLFVTTADVRYTTEAQVLIEKLDTPFDEAQNARTAERPLLEERQVQSQISVISSYDLAERVIAALNLTERSEFVPQKEPGILKTLLITLGFTADPRALTPEQRAAEKYFDRLNVYVLLNSNVIGIKYTAGDAKTAAEVANTVAETYVLATREAQQGPTGRAREWLAAQIEELRRKVVESEAAVEAFRAEAGLLKGETNTLNSQELTELNTQITAAEAARTEAEARAQAIRDLLANEGNVDAAADVINSGLIQRLREQQIAIQRNIDELSATYLSNHPKMVSARKQLANVNRLIRAEALKIVTSLEEQAKVAAARERSLRASLEKLKKGASENNQDDVKLRALEREAAANRSLLESMLNRYSDAAARQDLSAQPGYARIIQKASVPALPSYPKTGPIVLLATFAGLALSLGLAFLLEIMAAADRPLAAQLPPAAPEAHEPPPVVQAPAVTKPQPPPTAMAALARSLANVGNTSAPPAPMPATAARPDNGPLLFDLPASGDYRSAWHNAACVLSQQPSAYASAMRQLAGWALGQRQQTSTKRLAVISADPCHLDLAVLSAALARSAAAQGQRTMLVDASPLPSGIDALLGSAPGPGLAELLLGQAEFEHVLSRDSSSQVQFLRSGIGWQQASAYLGSERMRMVLDALEGVYDAVVVHTGQLSTQAMPVAAMFKSAVLVSSTPGMVDAAKALQDLRARGVQNVQCVRIALAAQHRPAA